MTRVLAIPCGDCRRKFGGQQTFDRHRYIAGDKYACRSDEDLRSRGFYRDGWAVWHRGAGPGQTSLEGLSEAVTPTPARHLARRTDPTTSARAATAIAPRTGSLKAALLRVYHEAPDGLTDEEAALRAGLTLYQATKRCADLRNDGFLEVVGERRGSSGQARKVCRVSA